MHILQEPWPSLPYPLLWALLLPEGPLWQRCFLSAGCPTGGSQGACQNNPAWGLLSAGHRTCTQIDSSITSELISRAIIYINGNVCGSKTHTCACSVILTSHCHRECRLYFPQCPKDSYDTPILLTTSFSHDLDPPQWTLPLAIYFFIIHSTHFLNPFTLHWNHYTHLSSFHCYWFSPPPTHPQFIFIFRFVIIASRIIRFLSTASSVPDPAGIRSSSCNHT